MHDVNHKFFFGENMQSEKFGSWEKSSNLTLFSGVFFEAEMHTEDT